MWSLETIVALNERAVQLAAAGKSETEAFRLLGAAPQQARRELPNLEAEPKLIKEVYDPVW